jgi:hypothetical protein
MDPPGYLPVQPLRSVRTAAATACLPIDRPVTCERAG